MLILNAEKTQKCSFLFVFKEGTSKMRKIKSQKETKCFLFWTHLFC